MWAAWVGRCLNIGNRMGNYIQPNSALGYFGGNIFGNGMSGTAQQLFVDGQ